MGQSILILNAGSSSLKFALYQIDEILTQKFAGKIERIGLSGTHFTVQELTENPTDQILPVADFKSSIHFLIDWLKSRGAMNQVICIGHRIVHGMQHTAPEVVTEALLDELLRISPCDPEHLPNEIEMIKSFQAHFPNTPQWVCYDTEFHRDMPRVAKLFPLPRRFDTKGIHRYGFHGLSFAYLMEELARLGDFTASKGRVILAHLGNGASLAAVHDGKCMDTTMGFTPTGGLPMSTRSGDLDPGLVHYLLSVEKIPLSEFDKMVNHESGLFGVSEMSSDMRDLLAKEKTDARAAEAVALFCYQVKKGIGSFAAALNGIDTLIFSGGMGENSPQVRARACEGQQFFGIDLDTARNNQNEQIISSAESRVKVYVIQTHEELMIAKSVLRGLAEHETTKVTQ